MNEELRKLFSTLQFIALALPAIVIYLNVLVEIYSEPKKVKEWATEGVVTLTKSHFKSDFIAALISFALFILSAFSLICSFTFKVDFFSRGFFEGLGMSLVPIALIALLTSVIITIYRNLIKRMEGS